MQQDGKELVWRTLKRPVLNQNQINNIYYKYRSLLSSAEKKNLDCRRELRTKTMKDLVELGLIE